MKRLTVLIATALAVGALALPATADKSEGITGTIEVDTPARLADATVWPMYGDTVGFRTTVEGRVAPKARLYVQVVCSQDGAVVYVWSAETDFQFPIEQQDGFAAIGTLFDREQPSDCTGALIYREETGRSRTITTLAQTAFGVSPAA